MIAEAVVGGIIGLAFGSLVAYLNYRITRHFSKESKESAAKGGMLSNMKVIFSRMAMNIAALTVTYLLRDILPLPFTAVIAGTAMGLSVVSMLLLWHLSNILDQV